MDYQSAANYWSEKDKTSLKRPEEMITDEAEKFINRHKTCTLATGTGDFVRCTPIEYNWFENKFWFLSEGGMKFYALEKNKKVSIAIYDEYKGFSDINGMQVSGFAEIIEPFSEEYLKLLEFKKIPEQNMRRMNVTMHLIKVTPVEIDFMSSAFKNAGYSYRQKITF